MLYCRALGWQALTPHLSRLPAWLAGQMVESDYREIYIWARGPFATRRELLEALRVSAPRLHLPRTGRR